MFTNSSGRPRTPDQPATIDDHWSGDELAHALAGDLGPLPALTGQRFGPRARAGLALLVGVVLLAIVVTVGRSDSNDLLATGDGEPSTTTALGDAPSTGRGQPATTTAEASATVGTDGEPARTLPAPSGEAAPPSSDPTESAIVASGAGAGIGATPSTGSTSPPARVAPRSGPASGPTNGSPEADPPATDPPAPNGSPPAADPPAPAPSGSPPATDPPAGTTPSSTPPSTDPPPHDPPGGSGHPSVPAASAFEPLRNDQPKFTRFAGVRSDQLDLNALTQPAERPDNGSVGDGQFRAACEYSHFSYDDPIVYPGQPGRAHLHMFYGNTGTDAYSTTDSLVNEGGGTCNGFELNRSAYWSPALLDGRGNVVVPDAIILYYKSKVPSAVQAMPQGLKMIAGNTSGGSFTADQHLAWSCGESGASYNVSNRIPDCNGDAINATIVFPNCWDGVNLDSADHRSHLTYVAERQPCPGSHPVRLPQISILIYYPGAASVDGWYISSDRHNGMNATPGSTLHADWWGGWNDDAMALWTNGCMRAVRNCSFGQTGTNRELARLNGLQRYEGPNFLPLPAGAEAGH